MKRDTTLQGIEEWTGHKQPPRAGFPWLRVLLALFVGMVILITLTGCATTTLYNSAGRKVAVFQGDMTDVRFHLTAAGDLNWQAVTVDHSSATVAGGKSLSAFTVPAASVLTTNHLIP